MIVYQILFRQLTIKSFEFVTLTNVMASEMCHFLDMDPTPLTKSQSLVMVLSGDHAIEVWMDIVKEYNYY